MLTTKSASVFLLSEDGKRPDNPAEARCMERTCAALPCVMGEGGMWGLWGLGFVPYLYRNIFNDKVKYNEDNKLIFTLCGKVCYRYQKSANIVETYSWQKQSRRGIVAINVLGLPTMKRKNVNGSKRRWIRLNRKG